MFDEAELVIFKFALKSVLKEAMERTKKFPNNSMLAEHELEVIDLIGEVDKLLIEAKNEKG